MFYSDDTMLVDVSYGQFGDTIISLKDIGGYVDGSLCTKSQFNQCSCLKNTSGR